MELLNIDWQHSKPQEYKILAGDYNELLRKEIILQAMMECGVHNWEGFDEAMERAKEMLK